MIHQMSVSNLFMSFICSIVVIVTSTSISGLASQGGTASILRPVASANQQQHNTANVNSNYNMYATKYVFQVLENSEIETVVGRIKQPLSNNPTSAALQQSNNQLTTTTTTNQQQQQQQSKVTYRFFEQIPQFTIDPTSGWIFTTNAKLDREANDTYNLIVLSSLSSAPINVQIRVLDANDNKPQWSEDHHEYNISEAAPVGTRLMLDSAHDLDEGALNYEIVSQQQRPFRLRYDNNSLLQLELVEGLDRELQDRYILNISVSDGANPKAYQTITIDILDINDQAPQFEQSHYNVTINDNLLKGDTVIQVQANDADASHTDNSRVTYYIDQSTQYFKINPDTGVIIKNTEGPINCQSPQLRSISSIYTENKIASDPITYITSDTNNDPSVAAGMTNNACVLTIAARDNGSPQQSGRAYVTVHFTNDNNRYDPRIEFKSFSKSGSATVDEKAPNGSLVAAVTVIDDDQGQNGETDIFIEKGNENGHFRLVSTKYSHMIQVNGQLDRHKISKYNLTFVARDHGTPSRSSTAYLVIKVDYQIKDNTPKSLLYNSSVSLDLDQSPVSDDLMFTGVLVVISFFIVILIIIIISFLKINAREKKKISYLYNIGTTRHTSNPGSMDNNLHHGSMGRSHRYPHHRHTSSGGPTQRTPVESGSMSHQQQQYPDHFQRHQQASSISNSDLQSNTACNGSDHGPTLSASHLMYSGHLMAYEGSQHPMILQSAISQQSAVSGISSASTATTFGGSNRVLVAANMQPSPNAHFRTVSLDNPVPQRPRAHLMVPQPRESRLNQQQLSLKHHMQQQMG